MSESILDGIIANHGTTKIVSENHDINSINWVAGMSDPGEMIACGAYQELRRHANESDDVYQARITVILQTLPVDVSTKIMQAGIKAAKRRAGYDLSNGRVNLFTAGKLPWSGLGVNVAEAVNSKEAAMFSGLAKWNLGKEKLYYKHGDLYREAPDMYGVVRHDTGEMLSTKSVGNFYKVIQNEEGFDLLDGVLERFGARYESAGSLFGGKQVWMLAQFPKQAFDVNNGDKYESYVLFVNCNDGIGGAYAYPTSVRVECANTLRMSIGDRSKGIAIRHTGNIKDKIAEGQRVLGLSVGAMDEFKEKVEVMATTPMDIELFANDVLDTALELTSIQMNMGADVLAASIAKTVEQRKLLERKFERQIERRAALLEDILTRHDSALCGTNGMRGTALSCLNAVTEHVDHNDLTKPGTWKRSQHEADSRKFESVIAGEGDDMKQAALSLAMGSVA